MRYISDEVFAIEFAKMIDSLLYLILFTIRRFIGYYDRRYLQIIMYEISKKKK